MTLLVGLKTAGGIVVAADSRGTIGDPRGVTAINDKQQKDVAVTSADRVSTGYGESAYALGRTRK